MTAPKHDELIELLLAGELSSEQQQQLRELMAGDATVGDEVLEQMWLEPLLRDSFRSNPDAFVQRTAAAVDGEEHETVRFTERLLGAWTERKAQRSRRRFAGAFAGGCLVLAVLITALFYPDGADRTIQAAPQLKLQHAYGTVRIVGIDGKPRTAAAGTPVEPGDTVTTSGKSSVTMSFDDNARVTLTRDASLTWSADDTGIIVLNAGLALVTRSKSVDSAPVVFTTQHATLQVPATKFVVATSHRQTDVTVKRGKVQLTGANGRSVEVTDGECGVARTQSVEIRTGSATPDTWSEDFESGLPDGWQGKLVRAELPDGSRGAVRTAESANEDGEPCHQVWTDANWEHGLAVVHDDTCLNFVYRLKKADRVQVLALLRPPLPASPVHDVQILQPSEAAVDEQWWNVPAGRWFTVSIPLSRFRNPVTRDRPTESSVATAFNLRPQDHACGLVIDRMWLARGTSTKIAYEPYDPHSERP